MTKTNAVGAWISPRRLSLHMGITAIIVAVGVFAGAAEALNASRGLDFRNPISPF